jgi:hypothetical protein
MSSEDATNKYKNDEFGSIITNYLNGLLEKQVIKHLKIDLTTWLQELIV